MFPPLPHNLPFRLSVGEGGGDFEVFGSGYHLYELVYDASNMNADLFVDGFEVLSDLTPATNDPASIFRL